MDRLWVQGLSHEFSDVADDASYVEIRGWTERQQLSTAEVDRLAAWAADRPENSISTFDFPSRWPVRSGGVTVSGAATGRGGRRT